MYIDSAATKLSICLLVTLILNINGNLQFENEVNKKDSNMMAIDNGQHETSDDFKLTSDLNSEELLILIKLMNIIKNERQMQMQAASANSQDVAAKQPIRMNDDGQSKGLFKDSHEAAYEADEADGDEEARFDNDRQHSDKNVESELLKKLSTNKRSFDRRNIFNFKRDCHLGLGMGYLCHAYSITKFSQNHKLMSHPRGPGRR